MPKKSQLTQRILKIVEDKMCTPTSICQDLESKYELKTVPKVTSFTLRRLWKKGAVCRSIAPIKTPAGRKEFIYGHRTLRDRTVETEFYGTNHKVIFGEYIKDSFTSLPQTSTRLLIKKIFEGQFVPEPLFPEEISKTLQEKFDYHMSKQTVSSTLNKMVFKYGELRRSKRGYEGGYLYHSDPSIICKWTENHPYKGISPDEKCILQLVREKTVITTLDIRREAAKGKNDLFTSYAALSYKLRKLKELIPWIRTEQYGSVTIIYDGQANPQALEDKLGRVKFWLSEEGRRKAAYGHEFESFGKYIFYDIIHVKYNAWFLTNIEVYQKVRGRFGEFDLVIEYTIGPPEFALRETLVFEFKSHGRIKWPDLFGYKGFIPKLKKEKQGGIFKGKFVRGILVLAFTIERGLPYELSKYDIKIIYMNELLEYLRRQNVNPDDILKAIGAKYYKPPRRRKPCQS